MSSAKGKLVRFLGGAFLQRANVVAVEDVGGFRHVTLRGDVPKPGAGTKIQLLLPSDDMRTYTPIPLADGVALLGWKHASGPGACWIFEVQLGAEVRFVGPQRSIELPAGPVIVVGDETSVAVAASFEVERSSWISLTRKSITARVRCGRCRREACLISMGMELRHLRYFVAVAEAARGSFAEASARRHEARRREAQSRGEAPDA